MEIKKLIMDSLAIVALAFVQSVAFSSSLFGVGISMKIERWLKAGSDDHIRPKKDPEIESLKKELRELKELVQKGSCDQTFPA